MAFLADLVGGKTGRLRRLWALHRYIRKTRPDVVVSFLPDVNVAALLAARGTGVPVIVSERTYPPLLSPPVARLIVALRKLTYRLATSVVVQSDDTATWIRANCPGSRPVVIANPVILPLPETDPRLRPADIVRPGRKIVLAVGRLVDTKRFDVLVSAFARIAPHHPDWDLVILGDGPEREALAALAAASQGRVWLPGFAGNAGDWYARADIYVMTSSYEGFPNTLVEAMAHGVPSIAFDIKTGPREIMENGRAGVLLSDNDHVARLAGTLDSLMYDDARRADLSRRALAVRERYSLDRVLSDWDAVFEHALGYRAGG